MIALIIVVVVAYLAVGVLLNGFIGLRITEDFIPFIGIVFLWPLVIAILAVSMIFVGPMYLGRELGDKYRDVFENFIDKHFND